MRRQKKINKVEAAVHIDRALRTLYISGDIGLAMASRFRRLFKSLEANLVQPIHIEINSPGGDEYAGMLIMDTIRLSGNPTVTRATGMAMSMGACILLAGQTREILPMSSIMIHQGSVVLRARMEELETEKAELDRWENRLWDLLDDRTKQPRGFWKKQCAGKNLYLDAREALEYGVVDRIVGDDVLCSRS